MGNKSSLRKSQSVPDTQRLPLDAPVFDKQKSVSQLRLNQTNDKPGKAGKKHKQQVEEPLQLAPAEATFLPEFPLRGDLEDLEFDIIDVIARGAYGNVIKVQREDQKKFYAVKVLDKGQIIEEGAIRQCKDEATIQSMAGEHPLVVKAHEYWQSRRSLYIVLDYVPHGDMFTLWTFHGAFPESLVQLYIAELATVIDFLHNASVIYRDMKMENILFNAKGHIQLTDFGLAKWLQGGDHTRTVCGTLQYMAPEVLSVYPYGHSADWWSLGILMYAMLAGKYPVDGADTHTKMAQKVFECDFLLPSHISDSAQDVINRVLTKSPHKRLSDVNSLQDLNFFQGIFFSDLIEQKVNPVDVVPEDFFPMTGLSWAPQLLTDEEQNDFDQFDNDPDSTLTEEPRYPHHPHYHIQPPAPQPHHHPDPVHRNQAPQLHNQQPHQVFDRHYSPHSDQHNQPSQLPQQQPYRQQLQQEQPYRQQPSQLPQEQLPQQQPYRQQLPQKQPYRQQPSQLPQEQLPQPYRQQLPQEQPYRQQLEHKKPLPNFQGVSSSHDPVLIEVNACNPDVTDDRRFKQSISDYSTGPAGSSERSQNSSPPPGYNSRSSLTLENSLDGIPDRNGRMNGHGDITNKSSADFNRRSYGGGVSTTQSSLNNSDTARRANDDSGLVSGVPPANSSMSVSSGSTNRWSSGPEYKTVEDTPTVTLRTLPSASFSQPRYNQSYSLQASGDNSTSPGYLLQSNVIDKQSVRLDTPAHEGNYQPQVLNTRVNNSQPSGFNMSQNYQPTNQGYKPFEAPPTVTVPSPQIRFGQNPSVPPNKDLKQRPKSATFSFPINYPSNSATLLYMGSDYQKLEQATVTLNSAPQIIAAPQRPTVPTRPIPAQKPIRGPKPSVPVKPIPAPRRSLGRSYPDSDHVNSESQSFPTFNQSSSTSGNKEYPYAFDPSLHGSPHFQNTDPVSHQVDWKSTPLLPAMSTDHRGRSGSSGNILPNSNDPEPETSIDSPDTDRHNFQWNLPAGTTPSYV